VRCAKEQQLRQILDEKPVDVNDPRNEEVLKKLRGMKSDYLDHLLADDARFQLHEVESFRHKLLRSRFEDPNYSHVPIP
jgi:hypothetical protein